MPVTTRRRAAALKTPRPSSLKTSPNSRSATRTSKSPQPRKTPTHLSPKRLPNGRPIGARRRLQSLPPVEAAHIASRFGHRLYRGEAILNDATTVSPTDKVRYGRSGSVWEDGGLQSQARYFHWKLGQIYADMTATREQRLMESRFALECAMKMLMCVERRTSLPSPLHLQASNPGYGLREAE